MPVMLIIRIWHAPCVPEPVPAGWSDWSGLAGPVKVAGRVVGCAGVVAASGANSGCTSIEGEASMKLPCCTVQLICKCRCANGSKKYRAARTK